RFIVGWKVLGHEQRLDAHIVNYADDFVICCRGTAKEAMTAMRGMMSKLRLTVNETKTRLCRVPEETFDFLGYTIGQCWSAKFKFRTFEGGLLTKKIRRSPCGFLVTCPGCSNSTRHQGKETDPWNLPPRSATCYSSSPRSSPPPLPRPSSPSSPAGSCPSGTGSSPKSSSPAATSATDTGRGSIASSAMPPGTS